MSGSLAIHHSPFTIQHSPFLGIGKGGSGPFHMIPNPANLPDASPAEGLASLYHHIRRSHTE